MSLGSSRTGHLFFEVLVVVGALGVVTLLALAQKPGHAAFPGTNGEIVFDSGNASLD